MEHCLLQAQQPQPQWLIKAEILQQTDDLHLIDNGCQQQAPAVPELIAQMTNNLLTAIHSYLEPISDPSIPKGKQEVSLPNTSLSHSLFNPSSP